MKGLKSSERRHNRMLSMMIIGEFYAVFMTGRGEVSTREWRRGL